MIATMLAPSLAEAPVATLLGPAPLPTVYEIAWSDGHSTGPFTSEEQAANWALNEYTPLASDAVHVDDDGKIFQIDADADGLSKHVIGEIVELWS